MKKRKLKYNRIIIVTLVFLIIIICGIFIYKNSDYGKLRELHYSSSIIKLMNDELKEDLINFKKHSFVVSKALEEKKYIDENLDIYLSVKYIDNDKYIDYINQLIKLKYNKNDLIKITNVLNVPDIEKLIKTGYIKDIVEYLNINYININYLDRYIAYKIKTEKTYETVVTYVNIGLDKEYYDEEFVINVDDSDSILVWVSKYRKLKDDYEPKDLEKISEKCSSETEYLRKEAKNSFEELCEASLDANQSVLALSAYRSYDIQQKTWDNYMNAYGASYTYNYVAKPGYSEHQTGLAIDLSSGTVPGSKFAFTSDYTWTVNNAYKYGFIIRYQETKENITGYNSEPWHIRYVGIKTAKYIYDNEITFDEYMATYKK